MRRCLQLVDGRGVAKVDDEMQTVRGDDGDAGRAGKICQVEQVRQMRDDQRINIGRAHGLAKLVVTCRDRFSKREAQGT